MPVPAALKSPQAADSCGRESAGRVTSSLQAVVFDFDGVIADSEPLHLAAFQRTLSDEGIRLTADDYYARYLGYDDVGMFEAVARDQGIAMGKPRITTLVTRKGEVLQEMLQTG